MATNGNPRKRAAREIAAGLHPSAGASQRLDLRIYRGHDGRYWVDCPDTAHRNTVCRSALDLVSFLSQVIECVDTA